MRRFGLLAALVWMIAISSAGAAMAQGGLVVLGAGPERTGITPVNGAATLTLALRNTSPTCGFPRVSFYPTVEAKGVHVVLVAPTPKESTKCVVKPGRITPITVRLTLPEGGKPELLNGVVVVELRGKPSVAPGKLRVVGKAAVPAASETVQPSSTTIVARRWFPLGIKGDKARITRPPIWVPGGSVKRKALLTSDSGHHISVRLLQDPTKSDTSPPSGLMQNKIVLDEIGSPGTYSGDLTLAPGGTDKVSLTVDVGDWILYPLIVVGLSALGGGFGVGLWQVSRRRQLLRARLDRIVRDYVSARSSWPKDDPQYLLDDELSDEAVTSLKTRIAATKEDADFDSLTAATLDLADDVSRWRQVDHGTRELLKLRHDLPGDAPDVTADTDSALDNTHLKPTDDVASAHLVGKLTRQARIAREFLRVEKLFANHRPAPDPALDPRRAYAAHRHAYLDDMHTEALLRELERLRHQLQQAPRTRYKTLLEAVAPARVEDELDLATVIEQTLPAQEQLPKIPKEDPARIERRVRMWDWILASVTAGLTILGFTFTIYSDHFGTWEDYGKALVAGFGGQLAGATIAWNAFPPLRSYTLRRPSGPA